MTSIVPRSWLFVPGSRSDRFAKALASGADAIIIDLEDAVADEDKADARRSTLSLLADRPVASVMIAVRINGLRRAIGIEDLAELARAAAPDLIIIPKAEDPADMALAAAVLADAGSPSRIVALIESARGVAHAAELARATPALAALMFGAADYAADIGLRVGTFNADFARGTVVNAAASGERVAIDSPFFDLKRTDLLVDECARARLIGFYGKAAVHPSQLDAIHNAFAVTGEEHALAGRILDAAAAAAGVGVVDGKMIDPAMERWARRVQDGCSSWQG